ncbi:MAG: carboxyl transferase domain-containing protein [Thermodesulfobacteriota bacterium]|nr:carboxyl transferase domain-containing protein [Thermodesulfobacteriota bacterium]
MKDLAPSVLEELKRKKDKALGQGGPERVKRQHDKGRLTARERIDCMLDPGTFVEFGLLACSDMPGMEERSAADGLIIGYGLINGRQIGIIANDFTVLASSNARIYTKKAKQMRDEVEKRGFPLVWLGESGGGRLPDIQGARGIVSLAASGERSVFSQYSHIRKTPWITAIMGQCNGVPTWQACLADFVVQVKGSTLSVAGARALKRVIAANYSDEDMGGWKIHAEITGIADQVAEDEKDCFRIIKEFLDYMPSNNKELSPRRPVPKGSGKDMGHILDILPEKRTRAYDMYKIIKTMVDGGKIFDLKPFFGKTVITCLARIDGRVVGLIASQPMVNGGAMNTDALDKMTSFMCLCDSFNVPLIFLHDTPGFLVGKEAELKRVGAKVTNALGALAQVTVPKISIIIRKSYGQAAANMCGPGTGPDFIVAWPTGESGFLDPDTAADVAYGNLPEKEREALKKEMVKDSKLYPLAQGYYLQDIIDPRDTRDYIIQALNIIRDSATCGIGKHLLANWPTKF